MVAPEHYSPTVIAENVHVRYVVDTNDPASKSRGLRRLTDTVLGRYGKTTVRALRGVDFVAGEGEMVGIVGANGSGKSTFLRNVAGVEQPDRGRILARYQPLLLGVSAALQPSLSGTENVRLGCLAMGLTPEESASAFNYVVQLSALGKSIHRPMSTYSSGMAARLRFAIALAARPRILLIDEALSTGDASFAERSENAMNEMLEQAGTVLLVNHAAKVIQDMCSRAVWMHRGEIIMDGPAESVAEKYRWWAWNVAKESHDIADKLLKDVLAGSESEGFIVLDPVQDSCKHPRHVRRVRSRKREKQAEEAGSNRRKQLPVTSETDSTAEDSAKLSTPDPVFTHHLNDSELVGTPFPQVKPTPELPLRLRPKDGGIVLRAADPKDRASSVASSIDLTRRRLSSKEHIASVKSNRLGTKQQDANVAADGKSGASDDTQIVVSRSPDERTEL